MIKFDIRASCSQLRSALTNRADHSNPRLWYLTSRSAYCRIHIQDSYMGNTDEGTHHGQLQVRSQRRISLAVLLVSIAAMLSSMSAYFYYPVLEDIRKVDTQFRKVFPFSLTDTHRTTTSRNKRQPLQSQYISFSRQSHQHFGDRFPMPKAVDLY